MNDKPLNAWLKIQMSLNSYLAIRQKIFDVSKAIQQILCIWRGHWNNSWNMCCSVVECFPPVTLLRTVQCIVLNAKYAKLL